MHVGTERMSRDEQFLREAIRLAGQARAHGNHPFGALLVVDTQIALRAENTVNTDHNPTSHAETNLIKTALALLTPAQLSRATLYTSCEPCAMCVGALYWSGIRKLIYALPCDELARFAGDDFLIPCRELLSRTRDTVEVQGPLLLDEAREVHDGYWS